jgi:hypothetical protein
MRGILSAPLLSAQNAATGLARPGHYDPDVIMTLCGGLLDTAGDVEYGAQELLRGVSLADSIYPLLRKEKNLATFAANVLFRRGQWDDEDPGALLEALRFPDRDDFDILVDHLREKAAGAGGVS